MPPMVEAMTMPRITQQMMIMIFFCNTEVEASAGSWIGLSCRLRAHWGLRVGR